MRLLAGPANVADAARGRAEMSDLGSWLHALGLAKYQALLDKNEIDLEVHRPPPVIP
jgi:hypothetical protein